MRNIAGWTLGFFLGLWLLVPQSGYAGDAPQVAQDHLALAVSYEAKAAEQDTLVQEHTQMKADYKARFFVNEKVTPMDQMAEMEDHCNAIIEAAEKEKGRLLEFAKWHQMRAAELQGL